MDKIVIEGGRALNGRVPASGAKNAALPLLFACLLTDKPCRLRGVPNVADIRTTRELLQTLGATVEEAGPHELIIDCAGVEEAEAPYDLVRKMRASFLALGPLVARFGRGRVSKPGGCAIGTRPIDMHLAGLRCLGAKIEETHGYVEAVAKRLQGGHFIAEMPSVGATENVMLAAVLAEGHTRIENAAREPEVVDLASALGKMGAKIEGAGSSIIEIEGVDALGGYDHQVIPDRIEAGTYLIGAAMTGGEVRVDGARADDLAMLVECLEAAGAVVTWDDGGVTVRAQDRPRAVDIVTAPHPGFPTDLQAQWMALMALSDGRACIEERIFENRFMHVPELARMGAKIASSGGEAVVTGCESLSGAPVMATDLRASVSLVLAGLAASGTTEVLRVYHLDRGYERIEEKLGALGARIRRVPV
jgi:UDP-N-acetylglucosamine 1-carboxyvinyltransferase